jgi:hypothetical protein
VGTATPSQDGRIAIMHVTRQATNDVALMVLMFSPIPYFITSLVHIDKLKGPVYTTIAPRLS